jgi:diaminopimelate decarboxylase
MRADLPASVANAIERANRPSLVFDLARIDANMRALAAAARAVGATALFAAKSFAHPAVRALAAERLDGFDVASAGELAELPPARVLSIADPTGRTGDARAQRVIVGCETVDQVERAPASAEIAVRVSASIAGRDPAVGAILDGASGHRRSRFGVERAEQLAALAAAAGGRPVGLHVHHGPVAAAAAERFVASARAALALAGEAGVVPRFIDLGGAWHAIPALAPALAEIRAAVPRDLELIVEPGRALADGAGFACGRVCVARDALRVADLSRICHLRWSQIELVGAAPRPGAGEHVLVVGATCFEEDVIGEWTVEPAQLATGARLVLRNVTGYAVGWNASFGGVPTADVVMA